MKRLTLLAAAALLAAALPAETWVDPKTGIQWNYTLADGKAILGSLARSATDIRPTNAIPKTFAGALTIPDALDGHPVTAIAPMAFFECAGLTAVTLPKGVTTISSNAFTNCSSLKSVTLPDGLRTIGANAFNGCTALSDLTFPDSVTAIGPNAFERCSSLATLRLPKGLTTIAEWTFQECTALTAVTIPDGVVAIEFGAFADCSSLTTVSLPDGLVSIGKAAFSSCSELRTLTIPEKVATIGMYAFAKCTDLRKVMFLGAPLVQESAFMSCENLRLLDFRKSVGFRRTDFLPSNSFYDCPSLERVTLPPSGLFGLGEGAFPDPETIDFRVVR